MIVALDYASPSVYRSERDRALLGMAVDAGRPVRLHGRVVRDIFLIRVALRALGEIIWSDDTWFSWSEILDPVITVHPDRIFFEAFSQDQSVYANVSLDRALLATEGDVATGTTNVDFTAWLWGALAEMRSSRETWLRIDPAGFEVATAGSGGRFEAKVDVPDDWVRGFLEVQGAMAVPGPRLRVRPVDLLSAIRFLRHTKARLSPRALRRVFDRFYQVDQSSTRQVGGTGLGLALVHRAVEAHRGTILVDNVADGGACFTIYLPARAGGGLADGIKAS